MISVVGMFFSQFGIPHPFISLCTLNRLVKASLKLNSSALYKNGKSSFGAQLFNEKSVLNKGFLLVNCLFP
jgi:hypothetical protein